MRFALIGRHGKNPPSRRRPLLDVGRMNYSLFNSSRYLLLLVTFPTSLLTG
jgi:hypothetical protein